LRDRRLDHDGHGRRRNGDGRTRDHHGTEWRFGNDCPQRWPRGNGGLGGRRNHKLRSGAWLGDNPAGFRAHLRGWWRGDDDGWRGGTGRRSDNWRLLPDGEVGLPCFGFGSIFPGLNGLEHVAGLGHVGEVYLGLNALRGA
jgi:hypothetical protein